MPTCAFLSCATRKRWCDESIPNQFGLLSISIYPSHGMACAWTSSTCTQCRAARGAPPFLPSARCGRLTQCVGPLPAPLRLTCVAYMPRSLPSQVQVQVQCSHVRASPPHITHHTCAALLHGGRLHGCCAVRHPMAACAARRGLPSVLDAVPRMPSPLEAFDGFMQDTRGPCVADCCCGALHCKCRLRAHCLMHWPMGQMWPRHAFGLSTDFLQSLVTVHTWCCVHECTPTPAVSTGVNML